MCSVVGCIVFGNSSVDVEKVKKKLVKLLIRASDRGRDSYGIISITRKGQVYRAKKLGTPKNALNSLEGIVTEDVSVIIGNTRAEPTTEFVSDKTSADIQPFESQHIVVSHNGTIANDAELEQNYKLQRATPVDSAVLPLLFEHLGICPALNKIAGSFAIAAADSRYPRILHLARNFKPISYQLDHKAGVLWFAPSSDHLQPGYEVSCDPTVERIVNIPPYTYLQLDGHSGSIKRQTLDSGHRTKPKRTLVIASGGLDSTVVATLLRRAGRKLTLLHFQYGCRAEYREEEAIRQIAANLGVETMFVDASWLGKLGTSSITEAGAPIAPGREGAEFPHEWVPARNMVMIAAACAIADARGHDSIALGTNLEEGGAYSDNTREFIQTMSNASNVGTQARPIVEDPIGHLVKREIVRLGIAIDAPLHLTWSCYESGAWHCGRCGPCYMRQKAFFMNEVKDVIRYASEMQNIPKENVGDHAR